MRASLALALSPLLVLGLARCSSFTTGAPESTPSPDAAMAEDAATGPGDDAATMHDPGATCTATTTICATFDTADWANGWSQLGEPTDVSFNPKEYGDSPGSLLVQIPPNGDAGWYRHSLPTKKRTYVVQAKMKFDVEGDGEIDFLGFRFGTTGELWFVHSKNDGSFAVELDSGTDIRIVTPIYVADPGSWNDVRLELSFDAATFRLTVGKEQQTGTLPNSFPQPTDPIVFDLGAPYATDITKQWLYDIDDVSVTAQ